MTTLTRPISWISAALRDFEGFPPDVKSVCLDALTIAAEGSKADVAKPLHGLGTGIFEIAARSKAGAFRVVYALHFGTDLWVVHAFQKKSTRGVKTPKPEIDLVKSRLKNLKEAQK